jgi:hypothetical protein
MSERPDDPPSAELLASLTLAQERAASSLGRLDGALRFADRDVVSIFAARLVRHMLACALADAGFNDPKETLSEWACFGPPPLSASVTICPAEEVCLAVLGHLQAHDWAPVAEAAKQLQTIAPHLQAVPEETSSGSTFGDAVLTARHFLKPEEESGGTSPLKSLAVSVGEARKVSPFHPGKREEVLLETFAGPRSVMAQPLRSQTWALSLAVTEKLAAASVLRWPLLLPNAVTQSCLRSDLTIEERDLSLFESIAGASDAALRLLEAIRQLVNRARSNLADVRSRSRAWPAFMIIAGFEAVRPSQLARCVGTTNGGAKFIIEKLTTAQLVSSGNGESSGAARLLSVEPRPADVSRPLENLESLPTFDQALADLERLLEKNSGIEPAED